MSVLPVTAGVEHGFHQRCLSGSAPAFLHNKSTYMTNVHRIKVANMTQMQQPKR